ncbi:hypothetical protein Agabi119p4_4118 [Agaricus bisporus var. burnettii]|uniref:AFG1-like ATPase n=1 Tax=Agaricus bisporus var. burnettii TaxID=192524 RepID=A0A8H7KH10_AGABI|nr:hypothetical protein Agabi119p4_4118 [Agaricus bisporus var. burnettii]
MKAVRALRASSHPRPAPPHRARFSTVSIPRAPHRAQNSSLASLSSGPSSSQDLDPGLFARIPNTQPTYTPQPPDKDVATPLSRYRELIESGALRGWPRTTHRQCFTHPNLLDCSLACSATMLMDLFYHTLPPNISRKRRVHFHAFMVDVHKRVHAAKIALGLNSGDPILPVARDLADEAVVLCFDEFQVTDIADAMILRRLLESLLSYGVVCVMTSNRQPDDLYKNGIQRSSFIPTIELLKSRFEVTDLNSGTDYRRLPRALSHVYYDPITPETMNEVHKIFGALTSSNPADPPILNRTVDSWGRKLIVPESTSNVAKFDFEDLCGQPLSAADYIELTNQFGTIFVLNIPKMGLNQKDLARRFITFIDACYESKTKLFVTSEVPVYQVFSDDTQTDNKGISDHMRSVMDDLGLSNDIVGSSSMFTGEEEVFAFARACSRLVQMGSKEWAETAGQH